jgi:Protein of unknown function (DUF4231)
MEFADHMDTIFDELSDLSPLQRHILKERYRFLMEEYRRRCRLYATLFYVFRITVTVGSLAVPALLSIQNNNSSPLWMYWLTWGISLAVTTSNGIMTLFKLDKRFFMLHATAERLRSETWQFIQLAGRYSGHHGHHHHKPTHANQYVYYCSQLEKINMKRVDEEYIKTTEEEHAPISKKALMDAQKPGSDVMVPSPADQSNLKTPDLTDRDSISLIGDDYDEEPKSKNTKEQQQLTIQQPVTQKQIPIPSQQNQQNQQNQPVAITMSVSDTQTATLPPPLTQRQSILSEPSAL